MESAASVLPRVFAQTEVAAGRILVADDQPDILDALRLLLGAEGFETDGVRTVDVVPDRLASSQYDLLLVDLNYTRDTTSGREGLGLISRVRQDHAMLPILVMTGWATIETAVEAMRRGANGFIQKPWDDIALVRLVQREIDESRAAERADEGRRRELDEARAIQRALLPATVPDLAGCRIAAQWTPASGLGGDCYDLLPFDNSGLGLSIADVIGKGIPAALLMANLQAATRAFATSLATPADVCASVNRLLCRNIAPGKFASFFYSVVDARRATLTYANAGHFAPVLVHADGRWNRLRSTGPVLGVLPNATFQPESVRLERGDRLVCFTDGITEAISPSGDEFGESRLIELACRHRFDPPETLIAAVMASVRAWTNGPAHDDATVAVVAID